MESKQAIQIGFIGGGHMTTNLIAGLLHQQVVPADCISLHDRNPHKNERLQAQYAINIAESNAELVAKSNTVVLSVKPQSMQAVLQPLVDSIAQSQPLVVSVAAGIPLQSYERWLGNDVALVRVMPNLPSSLGLGASGLLANERVSQQQKALTENLFNAVGITTWVESDADIDSITALSGSGPAYFLLFIQALANAAAEAGINPQAAQDFATQTAIGAARLAQQSEHSVNELIAGICSKGGTTEQAVNSLNADDLSTIVARAFNAAKQRSEELALGFSD